MIFEKEINKHKVYFKVQGFEHLPIHCHISRKRNSWKENVFIDLEELVILNGKIKNHKEILFFLKDNPNFVKDLKELFKELNPKLKTK